MKLYNFAPLSRRQVTWLSRNHKTGTMVTPVFTRTFNRIFRTRFEPLELELIWYHHPKGPGADRCRIKPFTYDELCWLGQSQVRTNGVTRSAYEYFNWRTQRWLTPAEMACMYRVSLAATYRSRKPHCVKTWTYDPTPKKLTEAQEREMQDYSPEDLSLDLEDTGNVTANSADGEWDWESLLADPSGLPGLDAPDFNDPSLTSMQQLIPDPAFDELIRGWDDNMLEQVMREAGLSVDPSLTQGAEVGAATCTLEPESNQADSLDDLFDSALPGSNDKSQAQVSKSIETVSLLDDSEPDSNDKLQTQVSKSVETVDLLDESEPDTNDDLQTQVPESSGTVECPIKPISSDLSDDSHGQEFGASDPLEDLFNPLNPDWNDLLESASDFADLEWLEKELEAES